MSGFSDNASSSASTSFSFHFHLLSHAIYHSSDGGEGKDEAKVEEEGNAFVVLNV